MSYYVTITHPCSLFPIDVAITGKRDGDKAQGMCITPLTGITEVWFTKDDIV